MKRLGAAAVGLLLMTLLACSSKEVTIEPAKLTHFEAQVTFKRLWRQDIGAPFTERYWQLQPAVFAEQVFTVDTKGRLSAFHLSTGKRVWQRKLKQLVTAGVAADDQWVYVGLASGELATFSVADGSPGWRAALGGEMVVPAALQGDVVVVQTVNGQLHARERASGKPLWAYDTVLPVLTLRGGASPRIQGGRVFAGFGSGQLVALDLATGGVLWMRMMGAAKGRTELDRLMDLDSGFWLDDGLIAAASYQGRVMLLDAVQGRPFWSREVSSFQHLSGRLERLFVADDAGVVWALDLESGRTLWQQSALNARRLTGCALQGSVCVVADFAGYLHALNQSSGEIVGRTRVDREPIRVSPLVQGDYVLALSSGGRLSAYHLEKNDQ